MSWVSYLHFHLPFYFPKHPLPPSTLYPYHLSNPSNSCLTNLVSPDNSLGHATALISYSCFFCSTLTADAPPPNPSP